MTERAEFVIVERYSLAGHWVALDQQDLLLCRAHARAQSMREINALQSYRPRPELGGVRACVLLEHARMLVELMGRASIHPVAPRVVRIAVEREIV